MSSRSPIRVVDILIAAVLDAISTLDTSFSPSLTISRLRRHQYTLYDSVHAFHILHAVFWLIIMREPPFPLKLVIPLLYTTALLVPFTSQFFLPASPIFAWVLAFFASRYIPTAYRPTISVSVLPTLESVLYGGNISDILTRFTHPVLDIVAWLPYGTIHFVAPFLVAAALWLFGPKRSLQFWASVFGYMNLIGVWCQIIFPCSAPWYELIYGLTPADYSMPGSPGGLARIDALFHSNVYTTQFSHAPVVFGAFPSLHAGHATLEALVMSHFFPSVTPYVWTYTSILYWATMYLTHHYLIDVVGGACLATACFYFFLPARLQTRPSAAVRSKYEQYGLEDALQRVATSIGSLEEDEPDDQSSTRLNGGGPFNKQPHGHRHSESIVPLISTIGRGEDGY